MLADPDAAAERLRALCLALPHTGERLSHGMPAFDVAGKMFCYFWHDHHGDGLTAAAVKTDGRDEQDLLIEADPDLYKWLPYMGPSGWIGLNFEADGFDWTHLEARLLGSWRLTAPKRLAQAT
ncbi:MmcQ/YjbR family DNA-binding protein [Phenylobacterium sp.]|jgi:phosphoribosylglycinamide formyltransferase-1/phosphoribosylamine--glycine ligase/phosphoribosylglycinamide formyltransferase/phosphoribosylformylglycinamidine cyclo-ligase|uniref:MmcQ/YjbR family DNA-binding protein n=1 Tax=Phenylobacterium sp. TaxID=1871053 RepID=UPI002F4296B0